MRAISTLSALCTAVLASPIIAQDIDALRREAWAAVAAQQDQLIGLDTIDRTHL